MHSAGENLFFQWEIDIGHPRPQFGGEPNRKDGLNTPKKENEYSVMRYVARLVNFIWNIETAPVLYQSTQIRFFRGISSSKI